MTENSKEKVGVKWQNHPWTQEEVNILHEMVQEYAQSRYLRKQIYKALVWVLGLPTAVLMVWEPLVRLWRLFKALFVVE